MVCKKPKSPENNNYAIFKQAWPYILNLLGVDDIELIIFDYWMDQPVWQVTTHLHLLAIPDDTWTIEILSKQTASIRGPTGTFLVPWQLNPQTHEIVWSREKQYKIPESTNNDFHTIGSYKIEPEQFLIARYDEVNDTDTSLVFVDSKGEIKKEFPLKYRYQQFLHIPETDQIFAVLMYAKHHHLGYPTHVLDAKDGSILFAMNLGSGPYEWTHHESDPRLWFYDQHNMFIGYFNPEERTWYREFDLPQKLKRSIIDKYHQSAVFEYARGIESRYQNYKLLAGANHRLYAFGEIDDETGDIACLIFDTQTTFKLLSIITFQLNFGVLALRQATFTTVFNLDNDHILYMDPCGYTILSFTQPSSIIKFIS